MNPTRSDDVAQMNPPLSKMLLKIHTALTQTDLLLSESADEEARERVLRVIVASSGLRSFERDVQAVLGSVCNR